MATTLKVAVLLYPQVCPTDYQGPIDLFSFASPESIESHKWNSPYALTADFVAEKTVYGSSGPGFVPTRSYDSVGPDEQYDIILVPGGASSSLSPERRSKLANQVQGVAPMSHPRSPNP